MSSASKKIPRIQLSHDGPKSLSLELEAVDRLRQHPRNPRAADPELIAQSLKAHGQFRALVVAKDGTILAGNHTYQAGLSLGYTHMWVHRLPIAADSQQAIEIMLADNRTSDFSRYDDAERAALLSELDPDGQAAAGYEPGEVDRLLKQVAQSAPAEFPAAEPASMTFTHKCPRCGFEFDDDKTEATGG